MTQRPTIAGPLTGNMTAWVDPEAASEVWYPIEAMRRADIKVIVSLVGGRGHVPRRGEDKEYRGGRSVLALVRRHERLKKDWWFQIGTWGGPKYGWIEGKQTPLEMYGRTPPTRFSPVMFRPLVPLTWPDALPDPLRSTFGPNLPEPAALEPDEPLDPHLADDSWPHPGMKLGHGEAPLTRDECEARILRAFRTSNSSAGGDVGHHGSSYCADIPTEMVKTALLHADAERRVQERAEGIAPESEAVRSGWTPTKRDLADWLMALTWLNGLDRKELRVLSMKAADPPFSLRQIKERVRVKSATTVSNIYERALDQAFAAAISTKKGELT